MLRDYQTAAITAVHESWVFHDSVMVEMATGLGKTEIFTAIASRWPRGRVLVVAPMVELVGQAARKIAQRTGVYPDIEQAHNRASRMFKNQFIVASKQTLTKNDRYKELDDIGLVVIDECHFAATDLYRQMLTHYRANGAQVLGLTATAKRHDGIAMANTFDDCPYQFGISEAVPAGWLVPAQARCVQLESLNLSTVQTNASGDFNQKQLDKVMEEEEVVFEIAEVTARESGNLKTAVFCSSVNEARAVSERLVDRYGLKSEWICADQMKCSEEKRADVLRSFTQEPEGIQIVCNVGVLTTGWDFPGLEHIVVARPTKSLSLYTQIFGRGTRPLPGVVDFEGSTPELRRAAIAASAKPHFLITDLRDNALEHKLITAVDVLGGRMGIEVKERAKEVVAAAGGPVSLEQALIDAKRAEELAREAAERKKRQQIESRAEYKSVNVNPFDANQRGNVEMGNKKPANKGPVMLFGKHKGKPIAAISTKGLVWYMENVKFSGRWTFLKGAIDRELKSRGVQL